MAINVITISGNAGKDATVRVTPNGKHIATFSLPAKSGFGENEKTSWLQCKMFGAMAEKLSQGVVKGAKITVTGEFVIEEWTNKEGVQQQTPTILVRDIDLPPKQGGQQQSNQYQYSGQQQHRPATANNPPQADFDDEIPFAYIGLQHASHAIHCL